MISPPPKIAPGLDPDAALRGFFSRRAGSIEIADDLDWHALLWHAGQRLVSCSLARRLLAPELTAHVPEEVREACAAILDANRERNAMMRDACGHFADILGDAGLAPVALKGVGLIVEGRFAEPGERISSDIDLWVPKASLCGALEALRDAGAEQVTNPYLPEQRNRARLYRSLEVADFRNDPAYAFYHVPAVKLEEYPVHLELHVGLSHARTALERWLETAVADGAHVLEGSGLRLPSPAFRLLHNFHHSQLKDGFGALGKLDWRHLIDAAALLDDESADATVTEARRVAAQTGEAAEFALHLHQLDAWLGVDVENVPLDTRARARIARFEAVRTSARKARFARLVRRWRTRARDLVSPRQLRHYYGPVPWPEAYANAARYRLGGALERYRERSS